MIPQLWMKGSERNRAWNHRLPLQNITAKDDVWWVKKPSTTQAQGAEPQAGIPFPSNLPRQLQVADNITQL